MKYLATPVPHSSHYSVVPYIAGGAFVVVVILFGLWGGLGTRKLRREPLDRQEARLREAFVKRQAGSLRPSVGIDLSATSLPQERIKEIAAECGYAFDKHVKNRNTNALRFNLKDAAR